MSVAIDATFRSQRLRLSATVAAAVATVWGDSFRNREQAVERVVPLVEAGQGQTVNLVDAYMAAKALDAGERGRVKGLSREAYTTSVIRGVPAEEVYDRPFGALGAGLAGGQAFNTALGMSQDALTKLVRTDLQLAQIHSARDWMLDEPRIVGYKRVLGGGTNCGLCVSASTQRYHTEDLAPIHERCGCSVSPIFGDRPIGPEARTIDPDTWKIVKSQAEGDLSARNLSKLRFNNEKLPDVLRVRRDPELGLRLVDEAWA